MQSSISDVCRACIRRKPMASRTSDTRGQQTRRVLGKWQMTAIGVGSTVGSGIYIVTGTLLHSVTGPSVVLSYLLSGFAAVLSALCYTEFASRVPSVGSSYIYCYVALGELLGFISGWNMMFELTVGSAGGAVAAAEYIDAIMGYALRNASYRFIGVDTQTLPADEMPWYPNLSAILLITVVVVVVGMGIEMGSHVTTALVALNALTATVIVCYGVTLADFTLWSPLYADGKGFMPFGFSGVLSAAAVVYWSYSGFDGMCNLVEEVVDPSKVLTFSILATLGITTVWYLLMSSVLSLIVPFKIVNPATAFADAFAYHDANWVAVIVTMGATTSMLCSLVCFVLPIPRTVYAMCRDHLLPPWLGILHPKTKVAVRCLMFVYVILVILILAFDLTMLIEMMAVGTLLAYCLVAASVIVVSKRRPVYQLIDWRTAQIRMAHSCFAIFAQYAQCIIGQLVIGSRTHIHADALWFSQSLLVRPTVCSVGRLVVLSLITILPCLVIFGGLIPLPQHNVEFLVPCFPWMPLLAIFINIVFMVYLNPCTWIRFVVVTLIGAAIYLIYGVPNSLLNTERRSSGTHFDYEQLE